MMNKPKNGEWWLCELRQGTKGRNMVLHRDTDRLWCLPLESISHTWRQQDVTPVHQMVVKPDDPIFDLLEAHKNHTPMVHNPSLLHEEDLWEERDFEEADCIDPDNW